MLNDKRILITGGTGSFGHAFLDYVLSRANPKEIRIFSRDEKKQFDMRILYAGAPVTFVIGDVRDRNRVRDAMRGIDLVFHAAALKQVPSCEFFPMEAVNTNILGTSHVLEAAEVERVEKVVVLSTDKAVYPINAMGISKAMMEKVAMARARLPERETDFCLVRYGNVMYSRGSVIPLFLSQIKRREALTITHPAMTRFLLPLTVAVELVLFALQHGKTGELFVRKAPACSVKDLAEACLELFGSDVGWREIGIREGEKLHETLLTREELTVSEEFDEYFRVRSEVGLDYSDFFERGRGDGFPKEGYTSENTQRLSVAHVKELLLGLPEVRLALDG